jgi:hypothetical protein
MSRQAEGAGGVDHRRVARVEVEGAGADVVAGCHGLREGVVVVREEGIAGVVGGRRLVDVALEVHEDEAAAGLHDAVLKAGGVSRRAWKIAGVST